MRFSTLYISHETTKELIARLKLDNFKSLLILNLYLKKKMNKFRSIVHIDRLLKILLSMQFCQLLDILAKMVKINQNGISKLVPIGMNEKFATLGWELLV